MRKINAEYEKLNNYFNENNGNEEIKEIIEKYQSTVSPTVPIIVMGLYSAGKSTFINSLIGREILPSASEPTTARNYKIVPGNKSEISFTYKNDKVILSFKDGLYSSNKPNTTELLCDLQEIVKTGETHTDERHMYSALEIINQDKYNNDISDIIEITVPFLKSTLPINEYTFEIYDTPGSDAASHDEHLEVLQKSIKGQTNGLPILVTDPDSMDKSSNDDLVKKIKEHGVALDQTNTIIVVNKSDDKINEELDHKSGASGVVLKWQSNRIFFVSSIMGLGSKKDEPIKKNSWTDAQYYNTYKKSFIYFIAPENRSEDYVEDEYKQLYKYNITSDYKKSEYENSEKSGNIIFDNSGLHCVESEITLFAKKYALYNKCFKAQEYLDKAIERTQELMEQTEEKIEKTLSVLKDQIGEKEQNLIDSINKCREKCSEQYDTDYVYKLNNIISPIEELDQLAEDMQLIERIWEKKKKEKGISRHERIKDSESEIKEEYNIKIKNMKENADNLSNDFWLEKQQEYQNKCMEIVSDSNDFSDEQKDFLKKYIIKFKKVEITPKGLTYENLTKGIFFKKLDTQKWFYKYTDDAGKAFNEISDTYQREYRDMFSDWSKKLQNGLIKNLAKFNKDLEGLTIQYDIAEDNLENLNKAIKELESSQNNLEKLLRNYRERSGNDE